MNLVKKLAELKNEYGYNSVRFNADTDDDYVSVTIEKKEKYYEQFFGSKAKEPTVEERTEAVADDLKEAEHNATYGDVPMTVTEITKPKEKINAAFCSKCGKVFNRKGKERICPDCKKKSQREATARYEAKKKGRA